MYTWVLCLIGNFCVLWSIGNGICVKCRLLVALGNYHGMGKARGEFRRV